MMIKIFELVLRESTVERMAKSVLKKMKIYQPKEIPHSKIEIVHKGKTIYRWSSAGETASPKAEDFPKLISIFTVATSSFAIWRYKAYKQEEKYQEMKKTLKIQEEKYQEMEKTLKIQGEKLEKQDLALSGLEKRITNLERQHLKKLDQLKKARIIDSRDTSWKRHLEMSNSWIYL